jgi:hypothetical protein
MGRSAAPRRGIARYRGPGPRVSVNDVRATSPRQDATDEDLASQIPHDRPGEHAYRRALAFFLGALIISAVPAFLSADVDLLDAPWASTAVVTAAFVALALARARAASRELSTRRGLHRAAQVALLYGTSVLFATLGGATLTWETLRFLDHRLDRSRGHEVEAIRIAAFADGRGTVAEYRTETPERPGTFTVRGDSPPERMVVRVHPGALGLRWVDPH